MPVALVTGGAIRVGRAIVIALARSGFDVLIHARSSRSEAEDVAAEVATLGRSATVLIVDLATETGPFDLAQRVVGAAPSLDLLVNSAADYEHAGFAEISPARFAQMMAVNVRAPFFLAQQLLPLLRASKNACIVNVTDMAVSQAYSTTHFFAHYLASKAALEQLTRAWALELGPSVRVNAVAPGPVAMAGETTAAQRQAILARIPLAREGSPEDVAAAVVYLASAPYVTGQTLRVDGGLSVA
jgi:pteridine reductase